ncbi:MAG: N-acetylneuraminate synthase [Thiotrichales bacterium SG8_50]|nr:MAG: N-acetylneuraminate synthase [Thiotrichales bacterium SG8_50]
MKSLPYIIAEIGSVHDGSFGNACRLVETAARRGADAVKFQTHIAEAESRADAPSPPYFSDEPRIDYFRRTSFTPSQWRRLAEVARGSGVDFLSSPFSIEAVDLLEQTGMGAYKIPSGEVSNIPLLERVAATGKPVYLSSGMSDWAELDRAVKVLRQGGPLTVMQCSSIYPCPPERVGLNVIGEMRQRYGLEIGFSDHSLGFAAAAAAVALGAVVIEKHFTFSRLMYGSDAKHSMEPEEFQRFCSELKAIGAMLASPVDKADTGDYAGMKAIFEKSVVLARALSAGTVLDRGHLAFKKPGDGISATHYRNVIGRRIRRDLPADHKLSEGDLE